MTETVPTLSILFMILSLAVSVALPVGLCLWFYKKKGAALLPFFIGCAVMIVFAFILESAVHQLVLHTKAGEAIQGNVWLYGLYGGLMAGLFEESGRFAAFKTVLRRTTDNDVNAMMYGAGHGGIEALAVLGTTSVNNLLYSVLINSGNTALLTASLNGDLLEQVEGVFRALAETPSWQFLLGSGERILAVILQLSFSVLVWFAAKRKERILLYPAAVLLHLIADAGAAVLAGKGVLTLAVEAFVAVFAVICAMIARKVWKDNAAPAGAADGQPGEDEI